MFPGPAECRLSSTEKASGPQFNNLSNRFDLALRNMPGQICNESNRSPRDDFATLADFNAVQHFYRMDLGAESAAVRRTEAIALKLRLHLRPHSLQQRQKRSRKKIERGRRAIVGASFDYDSTWL
jgi:hypothetical protein